MPFSTELDDFLAKVQVRVDSAISEAREELKEMAVEAEKEWSGLCQRLETAFCEEAPDGAETTTSHNETPPSPTEPDTVG